MTLWLSSRAALPRLSGGSLRSSGAGEPLHRLAGEIARAGADAVAAALDRELLRRAHRFVDGVEAYRRHPYRRPPARVPVLWHQGTTRLLDYGQGRGGPTVVVVPSLINRYYVLDLLRERSFLRRLAAHGLRPLVIDWGAPGQAERGFTLADYIAGRLAAAAGAARAAAAAPYALVGYCMGGLLALALALSRPEDAAGVALLATPWDFHAERPDEARLLAALVEWLVLLGGGAAALPVAAVQSLFLTLDPFLGERKFVAFAGRDPDDAAARDFVALEDWINDGVPLAAGVARECARSWYRDNEPALGRWHVAGCPVRAEALAVPALVVLPRRDRIVPPRSAAPLAAALPGATVLRPPLGHIGMMASAAAPEAVWDPIARWLRARLGG